MSFDGKKLLHMLFYIFLAIFLLLVNIPVINMIGTAFKSPETVLIDNGLLPSEVSIRNFVSVLNRTPFLNYVVNSLIIAVTVSFLSVVMAALAGYAISRYSKRSKMLKAYSSGLLVLQMFPLVLLMMPLFIMYRQYGINDTRLSLILTYSTFTLPFSIWLLRGFFDGIPAEIEEAGRIDGCSRFQTMLKLVFPVSGPGISSAVIFSFIYCWNEYMVASVLLKKDSLRTLSLGLQNFIQQYNTDWGALMAASTFAIIPALLFLIFMQKYIVQGLTMGAVKG